MKENVLLVVDVQKEFVKDNLAYSKIVGYIIRHRRDYDLIIATSFKNTEDSQFAKYLNWTDMQIITPLEFKSDIKLIKNQYGLNSYSTIPRNSHIDVIGMNIDSCVMKVAFDLFDRRFDFSVLTEYCYSSGGKEYYNMAVDIMKRNLGSAIR